MRVVSTSRSRLSIFDMWILLLLCVLQLSTLVSVDAVPFPELEITFPAPHSYWQVSRDGLLETLPVFFQTRHFHIPKDGFLFFSGDRVPEGGYRLPSDANSLLFGEIDPGSYWWQLELRSWNDTDSLLAVAEATLHVEVVVDLSDTVSTWRYSLKEDEKRPLALVNPHISHPQRVRSQPLPVCYVTTTSSAFDGQKKMWLQIMEALSGRNRRNKVEFQFQVKTFEHVVEDAPLTRALQKLNVSLHGLPLKIPRRLLSEEESTQDGVIKALLDSFYRQFPWARYDSRELSTLHQAALANLRPPYAARVWTELVDSLSSSCTDGLIIFSNSRSLSDELFVLAARLAGPRAIVMELANLHPTRVDVDILLSPSHFAKSHYSVARNVRARSKVVLSTGVDTVQFSPSSRLPSEELFIIGYVGRLSSEKSLGILLSAMRILAPICSKCRLKIVGEGPQKAQLQSLAAEWGLLGSSVEFVGGIFNDEPALVREFQKMHVFASPMFTETLGLAVLEAMSVGLPVVGFIAAGTGEFLEDGWNCVAVTKPTALDFANSLLTLVNNKELRLRLGKQARQTVMERFSTHRAIDQYAKLYERAGRSFTSPNRKSPDECASCSEEFCRLDEL